MICKGRLPLSAVHALHLAGLHNAANAMAALALCDAIGVAPERLVAPLKTFARLPHPVEKIAEKYPDYIAYDLYRDAQYSQLRNNSGASQGTGNNGTQTINIYGKAGPSSTAVPAGEYQDTITVTLTY